MYLPRRILFLLRRRLFPTRDAVKRDLEDFLQYIDDHGLYQLRKVPNEWKDANPRLGNHYEAALFAVEA